MSNTGLAAIREMKRLSGQETDDRETGYVHPDYAYALAEFGVPRELPRSGGWVLERDISGFSYKDAMGCYPLFSCPEWSELSADLEDIGSEIVALSLVADPFGDYTLTYLQRCFKELVIPFKEHFVIDLSRPMSNSVCSHHRRYARKALEALYIEKSDDPTRLYNDWVNLYATLVERHKIRGISAFSHGSLGRQLKVPGIVAFRAGHNETTVGIILWYVQGQVGYYHLGAYTPIGYEMRASFGLFWSAIEYFASSGVKWLNLGGGAGVTNNSLDGLSAFKRGWSTGTRIAYLCGHIFNKSAYLEIIEAKGISANSYFPAYRNGEFGCTCPL